MNDQTPTTYLHPAPTTVTPELTTSALVYLFADKLVPPVTGRTPCGSVKVPCGEDIMVPQQPLATLLFATTFWGLREQGHIILELDKRMWLRVRSTGRARAQHQGLEGMIMANLPAKAGRDAASVIHSCLRKDSSNPWHDVVQIAAQAVSSMSQDCGKLATFDDFARRWQRFQTSEPVLYKTLLDECVRGIVARTYGDPLGKGKSSGRGSGVDLGDILAAGAALGVGIALSDSEGSSGGNFGADSGGDTRSFFDVVGDFFGGLGVFLGDCFNGLGDFFDGLGDFMGDSDGGFDFD